MAGSRPLPCSVTRSSIVDWLIPPLMVRLILPLVVRLDPSRAGGQDKRVFHEFLENHAAPRRFYFRGLVHVISHRNIDLPHSGKYAVGTV